MSQVVEPDVTQIGQVPEHLVGAVNRSRVQRAAGGVGEHQTGVFPRVTGVTAIDVLALLVTAQRGDAFAGYRDASGGAVGLDRLERRPALGTRQGASHVQVSGGKVDVRTWQAAQFTLTQPGA